MFKIGDRVRFKHDASEITVLVVRATLGHAGLLCVSECGRRVCWAQPDEIDLDHRPGPTAKDDIKQAIREVLLSDEFLREFAKAFLNAPRPSTIQAWDPITKSASEAYCLQKMEREKQAKTPY